MNKIDTHVHAAVTKTPTRGGDPSHPEQQYVAAAQEMRSHLESQSIVRAVLMSSGETGGAIAGANNEGCCQIVAEQPDFFDWMCNFDPRDPATIPRRMEEYKARGAVGVGELAINEWLDSPVLTAILDAAEVHNLPVTVHMSPFPGVGYGVCDRWGLPLLEEVLQTRPNLRLVGHSQVFWLEISGDCPRDDAARGGFGRGPVIPGGRVPALMDRYPNLYADLSAYSATCAILRDEAFGLRFLEIYQDQLFYATDTLNRHQIFPMGRFLDEAEATGRLSRAAYDKITHDNAVRVYGL